MNTTNTKKTDAEKIAAYEAHVPFTRLGSANFYRHPPYKGFLFTDGARFVADTFGAYWLIDLIASHQPGIKKRWAEKGYHFFQVWRVHKVGSDVVVEAWSDTPGGKEEPVSVLLSKQVVGYSDFPSALFPFIDLWVENGTLLLCHEH